MGGHSPPRYYYDMESTGMSPDSTIDTTGGILMTANRPDPYAGLNRAQRRKAIAVEGRAWRKRQKEKQRRG